MKPRTFNVLMFASLAPCAILIVLWVITTHRTRLTSWLHGESGYVLRADAGRLCFERLRFAATLTPRHGGWSYRLPSGNADDLVVIPQDRTLRNAYGFEWFHANFVMDGLPATFTRAAIPFWPLVAVCAAPAVARLLRLAAQRRRRRSRLGPTCGYDVRASPTRCPECGTAVIAPSAA